MTATNAHVRLLTIRGYIVDGASIAEYNRLRYAVVCCQGVRRNGVKTSANRTKRKSDNRAVKG